MADSCNPRLVSEYFTFSTRMMLFPRLVNRMTSFCGEDDSSKRLSVISNSSSACRASGSLSSSTAGNYRFRPESSFSIWAAVLCCRSRPIPISELIAVSTISTTSRAICGLPVEKAYINPMTGMATIKTTFAMTFCTTPFMRLDSHSFIFGITVPFYSIKSVDERCAVNICRSRRPLIESK